MRADGDLAQAEAPNPKVESSVRWALLGNASKALGARSPERGRAEGASARVAATSVAQQSLPQAEVADSTDAPREVVGAAMMGAPREAEWVAEPNLDPRSERVESWRTPNERPTEPVA